MNKVRYIAQAGIIGAVYTAVTLIVAPISSGLYQVRVSEALTVLPFFTPAAIPGLFVGCVAANLIVGNGIWDVVLGSLATLAAAFLTRKMPSRLLAPLPPVVVNAIVVGFELKYIYGMNIPLAAAVGLVGLGEFTACYVLGYPLMLLLEKHRCRIFK